MMVMVPWISKICWTFCYDGSKDFLDVLDDSHTSVLDRHQEVDDEDDAGDDGHAAEGHSDIVILDDQKSKTVMNFIRI